MRWGFAIQLGLLFFLLNMVVWGQQKWPKNQPHSEVVVAGEGPSAEKVAAVKFGFELLKDESGEILHSEDVLFVFDENPTLHRFKGLTPILRGMKVGGVSRFWMSRYSMAGYTQAVTYYEKPYLCQVSLKEVFPPEELKIVNSAPGTGERTARAWDKVTVSIEVPSDQGVTRTIEELVLAPEKAPYGLVQSLIGAKVKEKRDVTMPYYLGEGCPGWEHLSSPTPLHLTIELVEFLDP